MLALSEREVEQEATARRQAVLVRVARSLSGSTGDPRRLGAMIVESVAELVGDAVAMWVFSADGPWMECAAVAHRDPEALRMLTGIASGMRYERGEGLLWPVVDSGRATLIPHWSLGESRHEVHSKFLAYAERYGVHSIAVVPLSVQGRVVAVLGGSRGDGSPPYAEDDLAFMQGLGDLGAIALDHARLLARARDAQAELRRNARLVDQVSDAIISTDLEWRIESWNAAAESIYGYRRHQVLGHRLDTLLATAFLQPSGAQTTGTAVREALRQHGSWSGELRERRMDGKVIEVTCSMTVVTDDAGNPTGAVLVNRDMSEYRELAAREQLSRCVLDSTEARTAVLAPDGTIVSVNAAWNAFGGGRGRHGKVGSNYLKSCETAWEECWRQAGTGIRRVLGGELATFEVDYMTETCDGPCWYNMSVVQLVDPAQGVVVSHTDVTWRKRREVDLAHRATHDPLTGLPNRTVLNDRLRQAVTRTSCTGSAMALFFLDLDNFKAVNDTFGHDVGDMLLRGVARRLVHAVRPADVVTRLGGDEFVVVAEEISDQHDAPKIARRLLAACETPIEAAGRLVRMSSSIGVVLFTEGADPQDLLRRADAAMYWAKERGGARFEICGSSPVAGAPVAGASVVGVPVLGPPRGHPSGSSPVPSAAANGR